MGLKVCKLLTELHNLISGLEMLESAADGCVGEADGNGAEGVGFQAGAGLEDVDGGLRREGIALLDNLASDLTFFDVGGGLVELGDDGEKRLVVWVFNESGGGSGEFSIADSVGDGGRHVDEGEGWSYSCRKALREQIETLHFFWPLLSCSEGNNGFFW